MNVTIRQVAGILSFVSLSVGTALAADPPHSHLYINGALASSRVIQNNGVAYVPIADVAKALNQTVVVKSDGYAITSAGGANQVAGLNGKIGDKMTNGQVIFSVVKVTRVARYERQFSSGADESPDSDHDLVVVVIRIKNATQKSPWIAVRGGGVTALTDKNEHAYKHIYDDSKGATPTMLPGSAVDFALVYSMSKSEKIGDFIYQIAAYDMKETTFRISLTSANL